MSIHDQSRERVVEAPGTGPETSSAEAQRRGERQRKPLFSIGQSIKPAVTMAFSRQLSSFLEAGIPLLDALDIVEQQADSPQMRAVIADIGSSIHRGKEIGRASCRERV